MELVKLPINDINDIPFMLRRLADRFESGEIGDTYCVVTYTAPDMSPAVCGYGGGADAGTAYWMLGRAMRALEVMP